MSVWEQVAERIRDHAAEAGTQVLRFRVTRESPLILEQVDGEERLEDGDDDFTVTDGFRLYRDAHGLPAGTIVRVLETSSEFLAIDAQSNRDLS